MTDKEKLDYLVKELYKITKDTTTEVFCECCGPEEVMTAAATEAERLLLEIGEYVD